MSSTPHQPPPARDGPAARRRLTLLLTGLCLLSLLLLLLAAVVLPDSGMETLILLLPWGLAVSVHLALGPVALWASWRHPRSALCVPVAAYFIVFAAAHLWLWAEAVGLPQALNAGWISLVHPEDAALHEALRHGDGTLGPAIGAGADVDRADADGARPLHLAVASDDVPALRALLDAGADPDARNAGGNTPLLAAARNERYDMVEPLLAAGADTNARGVAGRTALCLVVNRGTRGMLGEPRLSVVQALLAHDADPVARCGETRNAIALSARQHQFDALTAFVSAGHRLHAAPPRGEMAFALRDAIATGLEAEARILLSAGAPVTGGRGGLDPLAQAVRERHPGLVAAMLEAGATASADAYLVQALRDRLAPARVTTLLLEAGAEPDRADAQGRTPLYQAALVERADHFTALLAAGAHPNTTTPDGRPLLTWLLVQPNAARQALVAPLLAAGADPNLARADGWTALMLAAARGRADQVRLLLEAGAKPETRDAVGSTALVHAAAAQDGAAAAQALLERGASVAVTDARGRSPLCVARAARRKQSAALLLAAGADGSACP